MGGHGGGSILVAWGDFFQLPHFPQNCNMGSKIFPSEESLGRSVLVQVTLTAITNRLHEYDGLHLLEVYLVFDTIVLEIYEYVVRLALLHVVIGRQSHRALLSSPLASKVAMMNSIQASHKGKILGIFVG